MLLIAQNMTPFTSGSNGGWDSLDSCEEEAGRWGVKRLEGAARSNRHSTPIHVTVLCHFLDLLQGVTFLSF